MCLLHNITRLEFQKLSGNTRKFFCLRLDQTTFQEKAIIMISHTLFWYCKTWSNIYLEDVNSNSGSHLIKIYSGVLFTLRLIFLNTVQISLEIWYVGDHHHHHHHHLKHRNHFHYKKDKKIKLVIRGLHFTDKPMALGLPI